ncbi:MAG: hydroxyacid dehydrogenase [Thermoplasmata archaeon]|nr:hydroxyacid dehydrogenase [Thermoplasmata archaeon]
MSEPRVIVIADPIAADAVRQLREAGCQVLDVSGTPEKIPESLANAWGLVVRSRTKVNAELLGRAPHLALVARAGVGVDNIDMAATAQRHVQVVNAPTAATVSVAELTVALYLLLVREIVPAIDGTRQGQWPRGTRGHELAGRTIGFVGYGRIGREVAARVRAFGVQLIAFDPFVTTTSDGTRLVPLEELIRTADIVSLHAAATPENHHLINAARLAQMRPGAYVVNVARGPLVDEEALLDALTNGPLAGAALDVYEVEPPKRPGLLAHPKIVPTPHMGASSHEAQQRAGALVVEEILRAVRGEPLQFEVQPEKPT